MPFCVRCGLEYSLGEAKCQRCGMTHPTVAPGPAATFDARHTDVHMRRFAAGVIDLSIAIGLFATVFFSRRLMLLALIRRGFGLVAPHLYLLLKDAIEGKSIGKLLLGLVTYNEEGKKAAGLLDSIIRNWYLAIPFLGPTLLAVVMGAQILSGRRQRMGDVAARTAVISDFEYQRLR